MPRKMVSLPENPVDVYDSELDASIDLRMFTPEGDYEIPTSMEELLQECGLTFRDYYAQNYE